MNSETGFYLRSFLAPLSQYLERDDVTDIYINTPGELWVETLGGDIVRHFEPELTELALQRLARQVAAATNQGISREHPLLSATLPTGERVQIILPPATRGNVVIAIRKHVSAGLSLDDYGSMIKAPPPENIEGDAQFAESIATGDFKSIEKLRKAVSDKKNVLISGGTSSGKTTFLNALVKEIAEEERLIFIEDTPEIEIVHPNAIGLLAARSMLSEASVEAEDLLNASLRMRPDRIILGEVRGPEAFTFLRAINTGHPGSMTTIHADSPKHAVDQIALLVLQTGARLGWDDIVRYVMSTIDAFVQLDRKGGRRMISQIVSADQRQAQFRSPEQAFVQ